MRGTPVRLTADGVILQSGKPVRLFAASIDSAGTAAVVEFRNGTATSDTSLFQATAQAVSKNQLVANIPAEGLLFPSGLFVDFDANTQAVVCWAELVSNA